LNKQIWGDQGGVVSRKERERKEEDEQVWKEREIERDHRDRKSIGEQIERERERELADI
jgi:hypothetical protein